MTAALAAASCALDTSFDEYQIPPRRVTEVTEIPGDAADDGGLPDVVPDVGPLPEAATLYSAHGTTTGLAGAKATITINGTSLDVVDGPFSFAPFIADGAAWIATMQPSTTHACSVAPTNGVVKASDITGLSVTCISRDATLSALSASLGPIAPTFQPGVSSYRARVRAADLSTVPSPTTITATTTHPNATLTIAGATATSGVPTAPLPLAIGSNVFGIDVTGPDGATIGKYFLDAYVAVSDYVKASNTRAEAKFGTAIALSADTLVVGSPAESSAATGIDGDQASTAAPSAGAVYVYRRSNGSWIQEAYLKASNARADALFGAAVALDGDRLVVGSPGESSGAKGVPASPSDTSAPSAGAVYVFERSGTTWSQKAYVKPSYATAYASFGAAVAISGDEIAVGSPGESSTATGIGGNQSDVSRIYTGAVFTFQRSGAAWNQAQYFKASFVADYDLFGTAVALAGDTLVVGSPGQHSNATGIGGTETNNYAPGSGAAYVFARSGGVWSQQAFVKGSVTIQNARLGSSVALSGDTMAIGAPNPAGDPLTGSGGPESARVFMFTRSGSTWSQSASLQASVHSGVSHFGAAVALSGYALLVGAPEESSNAKWVGGSQTNTLAALAGAAYLFKRNNDVWSQALYVKASNTAALARFGTSVALSGSHFAAGAPYEDGAATGIDGDETKMSVPRSGAVYAY